MTIESDLADQICPDDEKAADRLADRLNRLGAKLRKIYEKFKKEK